MVLVASSKNAWSLGLTPQIDRVIGQEVLLFQTVALRALSLLDCRNLARKIPSTTGGEGEHFPSAGPERWQRPTHPSRSRQGPPDTEDGRAAEEVCIDGAADGHLKGLGQNGRGPSEDQLVAEKVVFSAPPVTKMSDGSQLATMSKKCSTLAGFARPESAIPVPNISPMM